MKLTVTHKKILAVGLAVVACLVSFNVLTAGEATGTTTVIAAIAALYDPSATKDDA